MTQSTGDTSSRRPGDGSREEAPSDGSQENRPLLFFVLASIITIPYWILGGHPLPIPIKLPVSALSAFNPMIAGAILCYRQSGWEGVKGLLRRVADCKKIRNKAWYIPILLLNPLIAVLAYFSMRLAGVEMPNPDVPLLMAPVYFAGFFVFAIGEELGWMGYAIDPLQRRWGALRAAILLGIVWGLFHVILDLQNQQPAGWIFWQRLGTVAARVLIVWLYNNTGRSVFAAILFHTMINLNWALFPNYGSYYNPFVTTVFLSLAAVIVTLGWGAKTLAQYRYARGQRAGGGD